MRVEADWEGVYQPSLPAIVAPSSVIRETPEERRGLETKLEGRYCRYRSSGLSRSHYLLGTLMIPLDPRKSLLSMPSRAQVSLSLLVSISPPSIFPFFLKFPLVPMVLFFVYSQLVHSSKSFSYFILPCFSIPDFPGICSYMGRAPHPKHRFSGLSHLVWHLLA